VELLDHIAVLLPRLALSSLLSPLPPVQLFMVVAMRHWASAPLWQIIAWRVNNRSGSGPIDRSLDDTENAGNGFGCLVRNAAMFSIGIFELLMMAFMGIVTIGIPVATLVLVILIYRNTRK
jgi:hypothetical protein